MGQVGRRQFLIATGVLFAAPLAAEAQQLKKLARVGVLAIHQRTPAAGEFLRRLPEIGRASGLELAVEVRYSQGDASRYPSLGKELLDLKCDLVFALGPEHPARAMRDLTTQVPVVFAAVDYDPVAKGLVKSLRRPGGNLTGVFIPQLELVAKRVEILRELLPGAKRILVIADPFSMDQLAAIKSAAAHHKLELAQVLFDKPPYDYERAFELARGVRAEAFLIPNSPNFSTDRSKLIGSAQKNRLPAISGVSNFVADGGLISYGTSIFRAFVRAGEIGMRILKGANPADIPIELPTEYELEVNLSTARQLGLTVPRSLLVRADRVIE